jgi:Mrp family chromosome partitioning ATPase
LAVLAVVEDQHQSMVVCKEEVQFFQQLHLPVAVVVMNVVVPVDQEVQAAEQED